MSTGSVPDLVDAGLPAGVHGGFTTRTSVSTRPGGPAWAGFNLGDHVGDDPERVAAHREALRGALGADALVIPRQVHGAGVVDVDRLDQVAQGPLSEGPAPEGDALVCTTPGVAIGILVADCVPVLLADPQAGVVGVAHAGRPGLVAGVVPATVAALRERGARAIRAVLGPAICGACYEVPPAMAEEVAAVAPAARARTGWGTTGVDVAAGVLAQLAELGVPARRVARCTAEDDDLYSYRRSGVTGRTGGFLVLEAP
ncbi:peptidoglycan editing factor PgeF [Kineococcus gynurae]|uniref:Purine nucleoside phosphorylase n=1 Tax=Kineococcus gynurae TaxID=452979 RepID=A0ABV5LXV2_9ACTN